MIAALSLMLWAEGAATPAPAGLKHDPVSVRLPSAAFAAMETINPEHIRWHVRFLSHDLLEGRGTGQRGGDIAAEYIATQFAEYGLKPAGENGSYLQKVPLVGITTLPDTHFVLLPKQGGPMDLKPLDEYVAYDQTQQSQSDVDADIVYVGYGIEAPEYNWDDYKGIDVHGKVLLMLVNEPPSDDPKFFKGKALTYYGRWTYKYEEAARKGAVGVILIHREDMASYPWEVVRNSNSGEKSYSKLEGPPLRVASWVQLDVAKKLAAGSGMDLDKMMADARSRDFHPVNLGAKLRAHMASKVRNFESNNVVAMLPGSNRNLKDEAVMFTAHYDHLGIRHDMPGDNIYNGAADNATGCGILLELARAYSVAKDRPGRSIIFAAVTAEEQGLLGSAYLAQHPPVPIGQLNLDLNFDEILPFGQGDQFRAGGAQRTTFFPTVEAVAKQFGYSIPALRPDTAGGYYRSDHFSFAHAGVPAFSLGQGGIYKGHGEAWSRAQSDSYGKNDNHNVSDNFHEDWDFTGNANLCRLGIELGWLSVTQPPIEWKRDDEFEAARKADAVQQRKLEKRDSKPGYCENCQDKFEDFDEVR